jgi:DMSO/TMAO reductase YedYZ heme-binding membrane subunit/predicted heme/steroid binding protein
MLARKIPRNSLWLGITIITVPIIALLENFGTMKLFTSSAYLGSFFLILTLIPPNLYRIISKQNWPAPKLLKDILRELSQLRRELGILSGIYFLIHGLWALNFFYSFNIQRAFQDEVILGQIGLFIFVVLLITSSITIQKKLKSTWKTMHAFVWLVVPVALAHSVLSTLNFRNEYSLLGLVTFGGLLIFLIFKTILAKEAEKDRSLDFGLFALGLIVAGTLWFGFNYLEENQIVENGGNQYNEPGTITYAKEVPDKVFTVEELGTHNTEDSCYIAYKGLVYDITDYLPNHPGGGQVVVRQQCGNVTDEYSEVHGGGSFEQDNIQVVLRPRVIGKMEE